MRITVAVALASIGLALSADPAYAQSSSEVAAARELFQEGLEAARGGSWAQARERFERSYAIAPRPTTLLNLAGAQVQSGQLVRGAESYRRFVAEARRGREARYRPQAQQALAEVEARIAHVVVRVTGLTDSDVVTLDGEELSQAALGVDLPLDPGTRTFVVRRGGSERVREVVTLAEGERREIALDASVDLRVAREDASRSAPEAALRADAGASGGDDTALWIGIGVAIGVVVLTGIAVGIALGVDAANAPYSGNFGPGSIEYD